MSAHLPYVVECNDRHPIGGYFEPIAAFNVECAATHYMAECAKTNPQFAYQVYDRTRTRKGKFVIARSAGT